MYIVQVFVDVKPECVDDFIAETKINAAASLQEEGIVRFDVLRLIGEPNKFLLTEVYRTDKDPVKHKETAHYQRWNRAVADMMASGRTKLIYENIFPEDSAW